MPEEFEGDLAEAVFWGADLCRATFRDVDLTGVSISHALVVDVAIDGIVENLTINGVDVTAYVNEHDVWSPLRGMLRPADPAGMRTAWKALGERWSAAIERASGLTHAQVNERVDGEWSFVETLRHLVFVMDKWFLVPVLGETSFHSIGMSNSGSVDFGWPGVDGDAQPSLDEVLAVRAEVGGRFSAFLETVMPDDLERDVEVLENGTETLAHCIFTVFEEEFEHLRYALRDLP